MKSPGSTEWLDRYCSAISGFRPGTKTAAKPARHPHEVGIVEILVGAVQGTPPLSHPSWPHPHREECVDGDSVHAVVAAVQNVAVEFAELIRHGNLTTILQCRRVTQSHQLSCPKGHFFGA